MFLCAFSLKAGDTGAARLSAYRGQAARIAASLDDRLLAAQVIMTGIDGRRSLGAAMKMILNEVPAGGIILFKYNLDTEKETIRPFVDECAAVISSSGGEAGLPPFVAVDHEGGLVHRFGSGVGRLPAPLSYWEQAGKQGRSAALASLEESARQSAAEIASLGITLNLAPVVEILSGENKPFLDGRSYGPDGRFVTDAAALFIRAMESEGIGCVLKHFPGNSGVDPHRSRPVLSSGGDTLDAMVKPFAELAKTGLPSGLMVSHALVPSRDSERIASLSPLVMDTWLRDELGFDGIVLADDFSMGAASAGDPSGAAVKSIAAGADMVITWPGNARSVHRAILGGLKDGTLTRERLKNAAERVIYEKIRLNIVRRDEDGSNISK
jgi:beta-N-acetylhexosaminidase